MFKMMNCTYVIFLVVSQWSLYRTTINKTILVQERIIKNSYERRAYESVSDKSLSYDTSQKTISQKALLKGLWRIRNQVDESFYKRY